jgi:hypothetical protein
MGLFIDSPRYRISDQWPVRIVIYADNGEDYEGAVLDYVLSHHHFHKLHPAVVDGRLRRLGDQEHNRWVYECRLKPDIR